MEIYKVNTRVKVKICDKIYMLVDSAFEVNIVDEGAFHVL